ncbi:hypothetical protein ACH4M8_18780 [Streptomyces albidoflavus]
MEYAEIALKYVQALAWPVFTFLLLWPIRRQLAKAVERLIKVDTPVGSFEFAVDAMEAQSEAADLERVQVQEESAERKVEPAAADTPAEPNEVEKGQQERSTTAGGNSALQARRAVVATKLKGIEARIRAGAEVDPEYGDVDQMIALVSSSWRYVTRAIDLTLATKTDEEGPLGYTSVEKVIYLIDKHQCPPVVEKLTRRLFDLQQRARRGEPPTVRSAQAYSRSCASLVRSLRTYALTS